jgi:hypothetical protein
MIIFWILLVAFGVAVAGVSNAIAYGAGIYTGVRLIVMEDDARTPAEDWYYQAQRDLYTKRQGKPTPRSFLISFALLMWGAGLMAIGLTHIHPL